MDLVLRYFLFLENELLKCCIVHFFCLKSVNWELQKWPKLAVPPVSTSTGCVPYHRFWWGETAAEATKARVKGRVHTIFSLYQKDLIFRSIQRDVGCGHRVSFPSILYRKAVKKYRLRMTRECTVHLFLSACKICTDFAVEDSRYFWTEKRCGRAYFQFRRGLIFKIN